MLTRDVSSTYADGGAAASEMWYSAAAGLRHGLQREVRPDVARRATVSDRSNSTCAYGPRPPVAWPLGLGPASWHLATRAASGTGTCASRLVAEPALRSGSQVGQGGSSRCSARACWNNRQVIPEILETYCTEKVEPRQKSTLDADSQRNHTQIVPFSAIVVGGSPIAPLGR